MQEKPRFNPKKDDPETFYHTHYDGKSPIEIFRLDRPLYRKLNGAGKLSIAPRQIRSIEDPIEFCKSQYPGKTRGEIQNLDPSLYSIIQRAERLDELPKRVSFNEDFFLERSPALYWVLGAFYASASKQGDGFTFHSTREGLTALIAKHLESSYAIRSRGRSRFFSVEKAPHFVKSARRYGALPKGEHRFPKAAKKLIPHFVRGFLDGRARTSSENGRVELNIHFEPAFNLQLYHHLADATGIQCRPPHGARLTFRHEDSMHIADFIYQDSTHIDENIYLPSLKEALDSDLHFESSCEKERKRKERVKQAIVRLAAGGTIKECAQLFCSYDSFYATYKTIVGEPPLATQHRFLFTCAKDLIDNGKTCKEVCDTLEITDGWLRELFRRHLEMSAQEYFLSREK